MLTAHEQEAEIINYPYAAALVLKEFPQLYIKLAADTLDDNWLPVEKIVSEKLEPNQRFSPYLRRAITRSKEVYEYNERTQIWQMLAVAVTASAQPTVREKAHDHLHPRRHVEPAVAGAAV